MKDFLFRNYKWYVAGLWVLLALTISVEAIAYYNSAEAVLYILFTFLFCYPVVTILSERLLPKALKKKNVKAFLWHMTTFTLLLAFFFALNEAMFVWFENHAVFPPSKAFTGWNGDKPFYLIFFGRLLTAFMINAVFCALRFFNEHYRMSREHAKLQQAHLEDELRLLRSQINPHMMFNVLNHIHILMKKNVERSDELLMRYSDALRYQLYECNQETVSLGKEVDYLPTILSGGAESATDVSGAGSPAKRWRGCGRSKSVPVCQAKRQFPKNRLVRHPVGRGNGELCQDRSYRQSAIGSSDDDFHRRDAAERCVLQDTQIVSREHSPH